MVLINVLDPAKHKADISEKTMQVNDGVAVLDEVGVLLEGLTIKADATPLEAGKDYTTTWNNDGTLNIVLLKGGAGEKATTLTATGSKIDPSKVKAADIVGGVDISSGKMCIRDRYRVLNWISCSMLSNCPMVGLSSSPLTPTPDTVLVFILISGRVTDAATPIILLPSR